MGEREDGPSSEDLIRAARERLAGDLAAKIAVQVSGWGPAGGFGIK